MNKIEYKLKIQWLKECRDKYEKGWALIDKAERIADELLENAALNKEFQKLKGRSPEITDIIDYTLCYTYDHPEKPFKSIPTEEYINNVKYGYTVISLDKEDKE